MADYSDPFGDEPLIVQAKAKAKELREETPDLKQGHALEIAAKLIGFKDYTALRYAAKARVGQ